MRVSASTIIAAINNRQTRMMWCAMGVRFWGQQQEGGHHYNTIVAPVIELIPAIYNKADLGLRAGGDLSTTSS